MTIEQVDHLFDLFDSDGSGKIDAIELKSGLEKIGNGITRADVLAI
jgi:Ca2+-binding EF-hand superfamily protein